MIDRKLVASVALFRELYDQDRDIYDVIAALLKAAIVFEKKWAFNTTEATQLLDTTFGFQIPEAVVRATLRNRLKNKENIVQLDHGTYTLNREQLPDTHELEKELTKARDAQKTISESMIAYANDRAKSPLDQNAQADLQESLAAFILDEDVAEAHSSLISSFIIENEHNQDFQESLNAVREGLILYNGIRYSPDVGRLGTWNTPLTIYLDTEHLFNAAGLNGELFEQLFDDCFSLVREINRARKGAIKLKYFPESRQELENFFHAAELIVDGKLNLDPSKTAMVTIVTGSSTASDVLEKKADLYAKLSRKHIELEEKKDFYDEPEYVVEGTSIIDDLRIEAEEGNRPFDLEACTSSLRMFTKINRLRHGKNQGRFPAVGHVLLTGKGYTRFLAFHPSIRPDNSSAPFAIDLEFATNSLWFFLRKGLSKDISLPRSLVVIAKAQVVLSGQINKSVSHQYEIINERLASGSMTIESAQYLNHELRRLAAKPEELTSDTVEDRVQILDYEDFEKHLREKSHLERAAQEGATAIRELEEIKRHQKEKRRAGRIRIAKAKITLVILGFAMLFIGVLGASFFLIAKLRTNADSPLGVFGLLFSIVTFVVSFANHRRLRAWAKQKYDGWANLDDK